MARPKAKTPRSSIASVRLTDEERRDIEATAAHLGFPSLSEYFRHLYVQSKPKPGPTTREVLEKQLARSHPWSAVKTFHSTKLGKVYNGDSLAFLFGGARPKSVDLIVTSPPFGLVRKKSYGNEDAHVYCDWFRPWATGFQRVLKDSGSLVIDIGGAWKPGTPTRSLYHFELLLMLCEEYGFHLCQEHYWWNPSKLPSPAEWVNIRRIRVKDAINCVWWLSKTPWPKATNRRVLAPYSDAMKDLLENGYTAKLRPSGHDISAKFSKDNGGAVPPNLLAIANTESNGTYQEYCRQHGYPVHPARFPSELPEYFIRMLTDAGDVVVDPFAGSCVTGATAERLGRKWACVELDEAFLKGAMARFQPGAGKKERTKQVQYTISPPVSVEVKDADAPLLQDGGFTRPQEPGEKQPPGGRPIPAEAAE